MTTKYCRPIDGGNAIDYAPDFIVNADGSINHAPSRADYAAKEWWWNAIVAPYPPEGQVVKSTRYEVRGEGAAAECVAVYEYEPAPVVPRRWSRLSIKTAIAMAGKYKQAEAVLGGIYLAPDYSAWAMLTDCDYIEEFYPDHAKWNEVLDAVAVAFGKTRAELDAFIDTIPTEN